MPKTLNFLFVITRADTMAGAQTHVLELSSALQSAGHKTHVITGNGKPMTDLLRLNNIEHRTINSLTRKLSVIDDPRALINLVKAIKSIKPDIVSLHSSKAGILGRLACAYLKTPAIFTAHGWAFADGVGSAKAGFYCLIERSLQKYCSQIICVSRADMDLAIRSNFSPDRLKVVHNGRHNIDLREAKENRSGPIRIVMIGRIDKQKDHETLFLALSELTNFKLTLVGDGPYLQQLKELAKQHGILDSIDFLGLLTDVSQILRESDIFVLSSNWEGFPRSTLEAMRAGLPVIVSDVGGSAEAVIHGESGFVVERGDSNSMKGYLETLVNDKALRTAMGKRGRSYYEDNFTFEKMYSATFATYHQVLKSNLED